MNQGRKKPPRSMPRLRLEVAFCPKCGEKTLHVHTYQFEFRQLSHGKLRRVLSCCQCETLDFGPTTHVI